MEFRASHRFAPLAARRVRNAAELIRLKPAEEALEILSFVPNRSASILSKVLKSAIANAGTDATAEDLWIQEIAVDEGPSLPMWWKAGPRGAAMPRHRRTTHVTIVLTDKAEE
jgi:large subunit ribosomal protein L22